MNAEIEIPVRHADWADPEIALPDYASVGAAGADLRANFPSDDRPDGLTLPPLGRAIVPTGLHMAIPEGFEMQIRPRSGFAAKHGVTLLNSPGTIDADYRGAVGVLLVNLGDAPVTVTHGMRIAQAVFAAVTRGRFVPRDTLDDTVRGEGGFGSTGAG
ncbi:dUTP diphosphatase [Palleronia sp. LCG004]|uniref:dUTP diphosphatase n=1 Tax=Palleronia sp. LCG004 TaxID=3079304 RepID=UPI002942BA31|nr:dUTP diphosphatase [Palleronia sp. LCG004]WOI55637.1 dUTP diphosphatase [Palleronia sp. LCG004]